MSPNDQVTVRPYALQAQPDLEGGPLHREGEPGLVTQVVSVVVAAVGRLALQQLTHAVHEHDASFVDRIGAVRVQPAVAERYVSESSTYRTVVCGAVRNAVR